VIPALGVIFRLGGRIAALLVFLAVMVLVVTQSGSSPAKARADARISNLNDQIESVRRENLVMEELVKFRRSDNFVVATAKRELGLTENDDIALEVTGVRDGVVRTAAPPSPAVEKLSEKAPGLLDFGYIRVWLAQLSASE